ncbi:long-chain-fatty-acid--CoA ligase [Desulfomonile tiedjei]|uniref:Acyl-CoA synthetase (AMP-forming)/AMP-acid ligase II n=1 Tax=Desulfomonile tiedjei (strain ATCC 49306 / DSM 6799 / DCB-1) TaxID=706587 RepID=I4CEM5_DESTA|nr:long-chain-fatty-acid--CoA ligase [Desulfomonile tiedjei]AFM28016.1 acyl-CoA synthetase (AMP-forming)/AMP-acid ligase II [Desulfomonile tiedjei DSM 6799]
MRNNVGNLLSKRAFLHPDKEAFIDVHQNKRLTYSQFNENANRTANALASIGVKKGDRVGILLMNSAEYMELFFAIAKIGAVCVPLNIRLVADELTYIIKDSGTQTLVYGNDFQKVVAEIRAKGATATDVVNWVHAGNGSETDTFGHNFEELKTKAVETEPERSGFEDDPLFIMYTSGTTGLPKGAVQTHNTVLWAALTMAATWEMRQSDRFLVALPLFHVGALMPAVMSVYCGIATVTTKAFDPSLYWKVIESERITNSLMVPTILHLMLQVPEKGFSDFSAFRWIALAGAPIPVSLLDSSTAIGLHVEQLFGLTEACGPGCQLMGADVARKVGSAGKPFLFTEVKVVDLDDKEVPPGTPGELIIQGKNIMREYWNLPEESTHTLRGGWLHTGDVATMDEEGFVYIVDRLKDMIISGGENIYPAEIEKIIAGVPGVSQVAVIGQPDPKWGETPMALVVPQAGCSLDEQQVLEFCQGKMARYKIPKTVKFMEALPLTPTGKVQKRILRQQLSDE